MCGSNEKMIFPFEEGEAFPQKDFAPEDLVVHFPDALPTTGICLWRVLPPRDSIEILPIDQELIAILFFAISICVLS